MTTQTLISVPVIVQPAEGSTASDPVSISGTGVSGATVEVAATGGDFVLSVVVESSGNWQGQVKLPKGIHQITARQRLGGSSSHFSPNRTFTVD